MSGGRRRRRLNSSDVRALTKKRRGNKYGAKKCYLPGYGDFDSKTERGVFVALHNTGDKIVRQVSLPIEDEPGPGRKATERIRPDFLRIHEVLPDGRFVGEFIDAKGARATADWDRKRLQLEVRTGLKVRVVRSAQEVRTGEAVGIPVDRTPHGAE